MDERWDINLVDEDGKPEICNTWWCSEPRMNYERCRMCFGEAQYPHIGRNRGRHKATRRGVK